MAVNTDVPQQTSYRKLMQVMAGQVVAGDWMQDRGQLRRVAAVQASDSRLFVVVIFVATAGLGVRLHVPPHQTVSVWRLFGER